MDSFGYFMLIVFGVVVLAGIIFFTMRKSDNEDNSAAADYAAGLNYLVSGDRTMALKKLREAARKNTENVDAYIKIGDILRDGGHVEQAIKVHGDLVVRTNLNTAEQMLILRSLEADFEAKDHYDAALKILEKIYKLQKNDLWAREQELRIHETRKDWKKAEEVYRLLAKQKNLNDSSKIAAYRVETGRQFLADGKKKDAREAFKDAIKVDAGHYPAYSELCEIFVGEDKKDDAYQTLVKFVETNPDNAAQAFKRMQELRFEIGDYGQIESVYENVITKSPENWEAYLALADIKDKKGEYDQAIQLSREVIGKKPEFQKAKESLVRYLHNSGNDKAAVEQALALFDEQAS